MHGSTYNIIIYIYHCGTSEEECLKEVLKDLLRRSRRRRGDGKPVSNQTRKVRLTD